MPDAAPTVGRAATPPPPNQGSSSLGRVLRLEPSAAGRAARTVLALCTTEGRGTLRSFGLEVFPAVPGLFTESVELMRPSACIVQATALERGPWAGSLTDVAPDLAEQLRTATSRAHELGIPVFWVGAGRPTPQEQPPFDWAEPVMLGSPLYEGVEEGAPASRMVRALRALADFPTRLD